MEDEHHTGNDAHSPFPTAPFPRPCDRQLDVVRLYPDIPSTSIPLRPVMPGCSTRGLQRKNMNIRYGRAIRTSRSLSLRDMWRAQPMWDDVMGKRSLLFHSSPSAASYLSCCHVMLTRHIDMLSFPLFTCCRAPHYSSSRCLTEKTLSTLPSSPSRLSDTRVRFITLRHLCRRADALLEMVENMKSVASSDQELTVEERNLLSVAYKNVIGARRASWRIVSSIEQKEESKGNEAQVAMIKAYREKIEAELAKICEDILEVLDKHLIPSAASGESKVFYHKM